MQPDCASRRAVLAAIASGMGVVVAGCSGTDDESETDGGTTPAGTPEHTPTATPGVTEEATQTPESIDTDLSFTHPDSVKMDEPFDITIEGLPEETTVEVSLAGELDNETTFESLATVETRNGTISLADPEVAVETEDPVGDHDPSVVDVPLPVAMIQFSTLEEFPWPEDGEYTYEIRKNDQTLGSTTVECTYPNLSSLSKTTEPRDSDLEGVLYEPFEQDSGPGVLVLHGSGGYPYATMAGTLASRGYTAFALDWFSGDNLPDEPIEIPLEYFQTAAEWLREYETTTSDEIGIIGASYGGMTALAAGSSFDIFGPVVSIVGSGVVFEGVNTDNYPQVDSETSMYTLDGEPLPYIPLEASKYRNRVESADKDTVENATIPVENIDGRVLLVSGAEDTLWDSKFLNGIAADRLEAQNHPDFEHRVYEDTGHFFYIPYQPIIGADSYGGSLQGAAEASHDHWQRVLETLSTIE